MPAPRPRLGFASVTSLAPFFAVVFSFLLNAATVEARLPVTIEEVRAEHAELQAEATGTLEPLAAELKQANLLEEAARIHKLSEPTEMSLSRVVSLPRKPRPPLDSTLPAAIYSKLRENRSFLETHSNKLYILGRRAAKIGNPGYAYGLIQECLRYNPDHQIARKIMGYERFHDEWLTPFQKRMALKNYVEHPQFGWILEAHVARYEKGERYYNNGWISAAREQELRRDLNNSWSIESEHFLVKTNHSLEKGVEISRKLEDFHSYFYQTFHAFFTTPEQMQQLFENSSRNLNRSLGDRHQVFYFASKDEYVAHLSRKIPDMIINEAGQKVPKISITNGIYLTGDRASYFYYDRDARDDSVIYHEATHQIFFESAPRRRQVAERQHFWLMEGIACYMESFTEEEDDFSSIGNILHDRFYAARVRYLDDKHYIPLAQFCNMSMLEFQNHPRLAWNYSQASGLTHFFMHYDKGRYRDALIEHLVQIYNAAGFRPAPVASLAELTETTYEDLDRQYDAYIREQSTAEQEILKRYNAQVKDLE